MTTSACVKTRAVNCAKPQHIRMPLRKPGNMLALSMGGTVTMEKTFDLSDTGTFGSEGFRIGSAGIVDTPLAHGQVSNLALTCLLYTSPSPRD